MTSNIIILLALLAVIYFWYIVIIRRKNQVEEALASIDVQLTKRHNLIPNILNIAKKFMEHEKALIEEVTSLRARMPSNYKHNNKEDILKYFKMSDEISSRVEKLLLQVEAYPDLKSDQVMLQAQATYNEVEEHISASRRFYNAAVAELNNSIEVFPGNIIAKLAFAKLMPFYKADEASKQAIDTKEVLNQ